MNSFRLSKINESNPTTCFNYAGKATPSLTHFSDSKKSAGPHFQHFLCSGKSLQVYESSLQSSISLSIGYPI